jgi:4'-phosphopantetheinyl transferase
VTTSAPFADAVWSPSLRLGPDQVDVWYAALERPARQHRRLAATLSADEHQRGARYARERDRRWFIAGRGLLRTLVSRYLGREPASLTFSYGPAGRPEVAGLPGGTGIRFSLSRSGGLAVIAVTRGRPIGVDVEALRPLPEAERIARLHFTPREYAELRATREQRRPEVFLRGWTAKEAVLKAIGDGLTRPLDSVEVAFAPDVPLALRALDGDAAAATSWSLTALSAVPGYVAALAVEGHVRRLRTRHFSVAHVARDAERETRSVSVSWPGVHSTLLGAPR